MTNILEETQNKSLDKIYQITYEQFDKLAKHFGHIKDIEDIRKDWTSEIHYIIKTGGIVKAEKINTDKIKLSLEGCTEELNEDIEKIIGN